MNTSSPTGANVLATAAPQRGASLGFPANGAGLAVIDQIYKADIVAVVRHETEEPVAPHIMEDPPQEVLHAAI